MTSRWAINGIASIKRATVIAAEFTVREPVINMELSVTARTHAQKCGVLHGSHFLAIIIILNLTLLVSTETWSVSDSHYYF